VLNRDDNLFHQSTIYPLHASTDPPNKIFAYGLDLIHPFKNIDSSNPSIYIF